MPIPTQFDYSLGEVDALASGIIAQLRILKHAGGDGRIFRERLQDFVDVAIACADQIIASREVIDDDR